MKRLFVPLLALVLAAPGAAQSNWSDARLVTVALANFKYRPKVIQLTAGQPALLRLTNASGSGHDFTAREFFAAAAVRPQDRAAIVDGSVEVHARQTRDIALVPARGRYRVKCTHTFHKMLGMSGEIVVN